MNPMIDIDKMHYDLFRFKGAFMSAYKINGQAYFIGNEVARILGFKNYRGSVSQNVESDDKLRATMMYAGQRRQVTLISEPGVYDLIFHSRIPSARKFKHWLSHVVLPKLFRTGSYQIAKKPERQLNVLINKSIQDLDKRTSNNSNEIKRLTQTVDSTMRVTSTEQYQLKNTNHRVVIKQLGGYNSLAYQKDSSRAFSQCWRDFKNHFDLPRYSDLPHVQFENGLAFLSSWHLHGQLLTDVNLTNDQITLGE